MSRFTTLAIIAIVSTILLSLTLAQDRPKSFCDDSPDYDVILDEDFASPVLNRSNWNVIQTGDIHSYDFACGRQALCQPGNLHLRDGNAVFNLRKEVLKPPTTPSVYTVYNHTTAGFNTRDKVVIRPTETSRTKICARIKLPTGKTVTHDGVEYDTARSVWPAFWLMGNNARKIVPQTQTSEPKQHQSYSQLKNEDRTPLGTLLQMHDLDNQLNDIDPDPATFHNCNPDDGEVDIMERYGSVNRFESTYHFQKNLTAAGWCQYPLNRANVWDRINTTTNFFDDYHEYAVERGPDFVSVYLDNELKFHWTSETKTNSTTAPVPIFFNNTAPFFVYINLALGVPSVEPSPFFPDEGFEMLIDYVKIVHMDEERSKSGLVLILGIGIGALLLLLVVVLTQQFLCKKKNEESEEQSDLLGHDHQQQYSAN